MRKYRNLIQTISSKSLYELRKAVTINSLKADDLITIDGANATVKEHYDRLMELAVQDLNKDGMVGTTDRELERLPLPGSWPVED